MAVFEDENADQKEVDAAVAALEEAVAAAKAENGEEDGSQKDHKVVSDDAGSKDTTNKTTSKTLPWLLRMLLSLHLLFYHCIRLNPLLLLFQAIHLTYLYSEGARRCY